MLKPPVLPHEAARLERLRDLVVLDTPPEPLFDEIAQMASAICGVPIALISLVDAERQWFKANVGLPGVNETPRDVAFCAHAIAGDATFEVPDATRDVRFADNPLVSGRPDIRFYAGAPLKLPGGERIGTLCVIDREARRLTPEQAHQLRSLAAIATQALTMRQTLIKRTLAVRNESERAIAESEARHRALVESQIEMVSLAEPDGRLVYVNPAYAQHFGLPPEAMLGTSLYDYVAPPDRDAVRTRIRQVLGSGESRSSDNRMIAHDGRVRWVDWTNSLQRDAQGRAMLHSVGRDVTVQRRAEADLRASQALLARTGRVAGVGGWELDIATQAITWSEQTRAIHEVGADYLPTLEGAIAFYAPEARSEIEAAVRQAIIDGQTWDLELRFVTAKGRKIWVRAVGEVEFRDGQAVRLSGALQDVTERKELEVRLAENDRFLRQITDALPMRIGYLDPEGRYRFANLAHLRRFNLPRERIIGRKRAELAQASASVTFEPLLVKALAGDAQSLEFDELLDGVARRFDARIIPDIAGDGTVRGVFTTAIDITDRSAAERELNRQSAILSTVAETIPAIVAVCDLACRYRFVNSAFERWTGVARGEAVGRTMREVLGPEEFERNRPWIERVAQGESAAFEKAYGRGRAIKHLAISLVPTRLASGEVDGFVGVAQDITKHKREQGRLLQLSHRDPLTGVLNRAGFEAHLEHQLMLDGGDSLALLYIDLDHFKPVNDRHGHPAGDEVLRQFARRTQQLVRPTDKVARLGGDEFAVVLIGVRERANAEAVADKIVAATAQPFDLGGGLSVSIGASVGVAFKAEADSGWQGLVERADSQLYKAKSEGRGRRS